MKKPLRCVLWKNPELVREPMRERFTLLDTYADESHLWRYLLKCRECGQYYFFEFYEEIDWVGGRGPAILNLYPRRDGKGDYSAQENFADRIAAILPASTE